MNNHKTYEIIESGITYNVLCYYHDDDKDYKHVEKFINKHKYCKIIKMNDHYEIVDDQYPYHPYYNPGKLISEIIYYIDGNS